jgi:hypothetical protein
VSLPITSNSFSIAGLGKNWIRLAPAHLRRRVVRWNERRTLAAGPEACLSSSDNGRLSTPWRKVIFLSAGLNSICNPKSPALVRAEVGVPLNDRRPGGATCRSERQSTIQFVLGDDRPAEGIEHAGSEQHGRPVRGGSMMKRRHVNKRSLFCRNDCGACHGHACGMARLFE